MLFMIFKCYVNYVWMCIEIWDGKKSVEEVIGMTMNDCMCLMWCQMEDYHHICDRSMIFNAQDQDMIRCVNRDKIYAGLTWDNMQWYMSVSHMIVQGNERFEIL